MHGAVMVFSDLFEEAEAKQHPWPDLGWAVGPGVHQAAEAQIGEALGQLEPTRTGQFQLLAGPCRRQTEPWSTIHQHLKRRLIRQYRQGLQRIDAVEGQSQAEQRVLATGSRPALLGGLENTAERTISRHSRRFRPGLLLKCMGHHPLESGPVHG